MGLYLITGVSGSGKSTTLEALRDLGYEAYDVDEAGPATAKWHNNATGYVHPKSSVKAHQRTPEFLAAHSWKVPREEVEALAKKAVETTVFLGGSFDNSFEPRDLFSQVFALITNDATITQRLATRTHSWGKSQHELEQSLEHNHQARSEFEAAGYTIIDANQPSETVVQEVLHHVHDN